jgi:hypothetical protein
LPTWWGTLLPGREVKLFQVHLPARLHSTTCDAVRFANELCRGDCLQRSPVVTYCRDALVGAADDIRGLAADEGLTAP